MKVILCDIEGTTTAIDFVHKTLFPYSREHMADFVSQNQKDTQVQKCQKQAAETIITEKQEEPTLQEIIVQLIQWIDEDRKHPALKSLQGMIWKQGYAKQDFKSHVYDDVAKAWELWQEKGLRICIYSSGSIAAQKLLFSHTEAGDLTPYIEDYFDLTTGSKKEPESYTRIAEKIKIEPGNIMFLSDVPAELEAAQKAGMQTAQLVRPGTSPHPQQKHYSSFLEIPLD